MFTSEYQYYRIRIVSEKNCGSESVKILRIRNSVCELLIPVLRVDISSFPLTGTYFTVADICSNELTGVEPLASESNFDALVLYFCEIT
jgi:hypothetical protein